MEESFLHTNIYYFFLVADDHPQHVSTFQGFCDSLLNDLAMVPLRALKNLPADIYELTLRDIDTLLARRIGGEASIWWLPISMDAFEKLTFDKSRPFNIVFAGHTIDIETAKSISRRKECPPLLIAPDNGDINIKELDRHRIQKFCKDTLESIRLEISVLSYEKTKALLESWNNFAPRALPFDIKEFHHILIPNYMTLEAAGFILPLEKLSVIKDITDKKHIKCLVESAHQILDIREQVGARKAFKHIPPKPDLFLFVPSMFKHWQKDKPEFRQVPHLNSKKFQCAFLVHQKQKGYQPILSDEDEAILLESGDFCIEYQMLTMVRNAELAFNATIVGVKAASNISAVLYLPNRVNRTGGEIKQFAEHVRSSRRNEMKQVKMFEKMQQALIQAIPTDFIQIIERSKAGIKIIADVPLEWLPIKGIPLGLIQKVSHIPVTPGDLQIKAMVSKPNIHLTKESFFDILICSALASNDVIHDIFEQALQSMQPSWRDKLKLKIVETKSRSELVEAMNNFQGTLMIFYGHGSHRSGNELATLLLHDEYIETWSLRQDVHRPPPIVFLFACDTYAADRSHATTASGFLDLGVLTVMGSYLPLEGKEAALFLVRLLNYIAHRMPTITEHEQGHALSWQDIISEMLRMTLLSEFLMRLQVHKVIDKDIEEDFLQRGQLYFNINPIDSFEKLLNELSQASGVPIEQLEFHLKTTIANSTTISYVQLGNPESIIINRKDFLMK